MQLQSQPMVHTVTVMTRHADEIFNELNNPNFKIDLTKLRFEIHKNNLYNSYYLNQILKEQLEIKELLNGNTGQESESNVEAKLSELEKRFKQYLREDLTGDIASAMDNINILRFQYFSNSLFQNI